MYEWDAEDYARHSAAQESWARELLQSIALRADDRVLDIGSGDGRITAAIAERVPQGRVLGIDASQDMVRHARATFTRADHPNLEFERVDARALPFEAQFTLVYSGATLHWVTDHAPVIAGIARALLPGGRFVAQMGGRGNAAGMIAALETVAKRPRWVAAFTGFTFPYGFHDAEDYRGWLHAAAFDVDEARLIPKDMVHRDRAALVGWLRSAWLPYSERVAKAQRTAFIDAVADEYLAHHPPDASGAVHVEMVRLQVRARRR